MHCSSNYPTKRHWLISFKATGYCLFLFPALQKELTFFLSGFLLPVFSLQVRYITSIGHLSLTLPFTLTLIPSLFSSSLLPSLPRNLLPSSIHASIHTSIHPLTHPFYYCSFTLSRIHSLTRYLLPSSTHTFTHSTIHTLTHPLPWLLIHSLTLFHSLFPSLTDFLTLQMVFKILLFDVDSLRN